MSHYEDSKTNAVNAKITFPETATNYLKVTCQNLKEILVVGIRGTFFVSFFAVIGGGFGYLLGAHPTLWIRAIVGGIVIFCFIIWISLWDPGCSYNRRRYLGMNKH